MEDKPIQMQVKKFAKKYVPLENRKKFCQLMKAFDNDNSYVLDEFFNIDVLQMKLKESNEGII